MEGFLSSCRRAVQANTDQGQRFHVVMGNEACDVDSMVSAVAYAYFLSKTAHSDALIIPVLNIARSDLPLRSDNMFLLQQSGLSPDLLLFRDQLDLKVLQRSGRLQLTLVDHNVLPSSDSDLEGAVVEVIDHHLQEREPTSSCPVTIEMVGSCATLVTEHILQKAPQILDQQLAQLLYETKTRQLEKQLSSVLVTDRSSLHDIAAPTTLVLDCVNMAPAAGKVTPKDSLYAAALETRFPDLPPRGALFQALQNAKFDVSGLNTEQMLLKDMKVVSGSLNLAVSVLYVTLEEFLQRAALEAELSRFCEKYGFNLLLLMTISFTESKEPIRELAVFSLSTTCREQVSLYLEQARNPPLNLCPISSPHTHITAYQQGNALASRKKVLPIVKDFLMERDRDMDDDESQVPPTPMNSLVDGCPLDDGLPHISAQDLEEKFSKIKADSGGK